MLPPTLPSLYRSVLSSFFFLLLGASSNFGTYFIVKKAKKQKRFRHRSYSDPCFLPSAPLLYECIIQPFFFFFHGCTIQLWFCLNMACKHTDDDDAPGVKMFLFKYVPRLEEYLVYQLFH